MYDNKRSATGKWKRVLTAAALAACMIMALPVWTVGRAQAEPLDLDNGGCTITVQRNVTDAALQGNVVVDLYKVASAEKVTGYDAYTLKPCNEFDYIANDLEKAQKENSGASAADGGNAQYRALAQTAAGIVLKGTGAQKAAAIDLSGESSTSDGLDPGMYLVVAHGKDLDIKQYVTETEIEGTTQKQLATIAYSDEYIYTYLPELISLPMKVGTDGSSPVGSFNTADTGEWKNDVTITLKSEEGLRLASLTIGKTFMTNSGEAALVNKDGCVFQIEAELDGKVVYSNVAAIPYEGRATGDVTLSNVIPVGAKVTVTEVYSGASFTLTDNDNVEEIPAAVADGENGSVNNIVNFTNTYNGSNIGGDVVTNSFTHGASGWTWNNPRPASTPQQ